jgi:glycosyltransferase involved in cell wall biosynthesis
MLRPVSPAKSPLVTVDARMLRSTGIGVYLRALLPRVIGRLGEVRFCLLGDPVALEPFAAGAQVERRRLRAGVYAPSEQPGLWARTPRDTRVFWAPHVNAPLFGAGRLLVTVHDAFYANPPAGARPRWDKQLYLDVMLRGLRRRAAAVLCDSTFTRDELERHLGAFRSPLHVVPLGIEPAWFEKTAAPRPHAAPYLVYLGNLKPHKNLPRMLAAFAEIAERVPHDFVLVGPGDAEALRRALPARLRARVHFPGAVTEPELKAYVAHAAGLVLVSLYEGFGLPPLEAMALGVPALVSRAASLPEVCGEAALYCDPESVSDIARGLHTLLTDESQRAELVARGLRRARELDWDTCADKTSVVLSGLL